MNYIIRFYKCQTTVSTPKDEKTSVEFYSKFRLYSIKRNLV